MKKKLKTQTLSAIKFVSVLLVFSVFLLQCQPTSKFIKKDPPDFQKENISQPLQDFLGEEIIDAIAHANKLRAHWLDDQFDNEVDNDSGTNNADQEFNGKINSDSKSKTPEKINGIKIKKKGSYLSRIEMKNFQSWLGNAEHYNFNIKKRCLFHPQVLFELEGEKNVWVWVSFTCRQWKFQLKEEKNISHRIEDIMSIEANLAYLAQRSLNDKKILTEYIPQEPQADKTKKETDQEIQNQIEGEKEKGEAK